MTKTCLIGGAAAAGPAAVNTATTVASRATMMRCTGTALPAREEGETRSDRSFCSGRFPGAVTDRTDTISMPDGGSMGAFVALPAEGHRPGVRVLMEVLGVGPYIRGACERLAELGYVAMAPDLYRRLSPGLELPHDEAGVAKAMETVQGLDGEGAVADAGGGLGGPGGAPQGPGGAAGGGGGGCPRGGAPPLPVPAGPPPPR